MRWQLNRADAVATVSNTAKQELIEAHATKRPIYTVSNAVSQDFTPTIDTPHYASNDVVYMGAFTPYKNVECLIGALQYATDITLHLCSKVPTGRKKQLVALADTLGVAERIIWHNGISDTDYQSLLESARCSISASKIEGFGLPILEAQSKGVPMLCSDIPIFHEVGGSGVLYFNHTDPKAAAEGINALAIQSVSSELIARGYENAKRYTWRASTDELIQLLHRIY
jgi:glycosyltransferase involved in cell wall biosynthesis